MESYLDFLDDQRDALKESMEQNFLNACTSGNLKYVNEFFYSREHDINMIDHDGNTPLILAASNGHYHVVKKLLEHPLIDVHVKNDYGLNAFFVAERNGHLDIVNLIRCHGIPSPDPSPAPMSWFEYLRKIFFFME